VAGKGANWPGAIDGPRCRIGIEVTTLLRCDRPRSGNGGHLF
jgi:hypothetical protein